MKDLFARLLAAATLAAALLAGLASVAQAQAPGPVLQQVVISGHRQRFDNPKAAAVVRYILIDPGNADPVRDGFAPLERKAVLVLYIGGDGTLNLGNGQTNTGSPNTLARNRYHFAAHGFVVAVVDAANDFNALPNGLIGHRLPESPLGDRYLKDLQAVMASLRARYPGLPIWGVGHSRGTVSAAVTAVAVTPPADGLVLASSVTGPDPASEELSRVALETIAAPVLIASHRDDQCPNTRPEDSKALQERFTASPLVHFSQFEGGSAPLSDPCNALAPHGFFGIDQKVVDAVAKRIARAVSGTGEQEADHRRDREADRAGRPF